MIITSKLPAAPSLLLSTGQSTWNLHHPGVERAKMAQTHQGFSRGMDQCLFNTCIHRHTWMHPDHLPVGADLSLPQPCHRQNCLPPDSTALTQGTSPQGLHNRPVEYQEFVSSVHQQWLFWFGRVLPREMFLLKLRAWKTLSALTRNEGSLLQTTCLQTDVFSKPLRKKWGIHHKTYVGSFT